MIEARPVDELGAVDGELLGDAAAHRGADQVGVRQAERGEQPGGVGDQVGEPVAHGRKITLE
jgi:hypothetical protein